MRGRPLSLRARARTGSWSDVSWSDVLPPRAGRRPVDAAAEHGPVARSSPERRLAAILAADVVGYSRMMHEDEEATLATLSSHREIIDGVITGGRGHVIGSAGDSVLAEFASIIDAVNCGVSIQLALGQENALAPPQRRMELRIGINVGDVMVKDGGVFGDGVNVAARLEGLAEPGGILVTRSVRDQVRDRVDYGFVDLGERCVKNIARPLRVFRVVFDRGASARSPDPRGPSAAAVESGTPAARGAVVLVVENDPLVRALAVDVLEEAGFEVIEAPSADYAVLVLEKRPDIRVVFTDIEMPGELDGIQLARIVQRRYHRAGVVVGSGGARPRSSELSTDATFLSKPYAPAALVEAVRKLGA